MPKAPRHRPRARIRLTGAGGWGLATCLVIAAAAANTANNLLYLLLGLLVAAHAVSAWASRRVLLDLHADLDAPPEVRRMQEAGIVATLSTPARRAPGVVLDLSGTDAAGRAVPRVTRTFSVLTRDASASVALPFVPGRRGPARVTLTARSPFPFGLIESERPVASAEILVLPDRDPSWRRSVEASASEWEALARKGEGTEIFNIRNHAWGDDARRMDWKATARLGRPMVREHAREEQRHAVLVLPSLPASSEDFTERAISRAAGAAEDLGREGWTLRLLAPGRTPESPSVDVRGDARAILRALARLEAGAAPPEGWWRSRVAPSESPLVLGGAPGPA